MNMRLEGLDVLSARANPMDQEEEDQRKLSSRLEWLESARKLSSRLERLLTRENDVANFEDVQTQTKRKARDPPPPSMTMVKKSKSKRMTLRKKYGVIRKVKEHHRKKTKEAKKLGLVGRRKVKVEKDRGIRNDYDWPFKEQELKALEERRACALEEWSRRRLPVKRGLKREKKTKLPPVRRGLKRERRRNIFLS